MTRRGRNPRRAYDKDGNEIAPATVASTRATDIHSVVAFCEPCGHMGVVSLDHFPEDFPIPDIALKVRGAAGGSKQIAVHLNVDEIRPKESG